jgi:hypothetical protein
MDAYCEEWSEALNWGIRVEYVGHGERNIRQNRYIIHYDTFISRGSAI